MNQHGNNPRVVILTAIPVEYQMVRAHLSQLREELHPSGIIYEHGIFVNERRQWHIVLTETGAGNVNAAIEAERAIMHFAPDYVFFVGVAGGLKDVRLGDVVVATKVYGYESGKESLSFQTRPDMGITPYSMVQRARKEARKQDWLHHLKGSIPAPPPRVFIAPIVAGEKVINSTQSATWKFLKTSYGDALAVEMEGYGFLKAMYACQQSNSLVIRGISDLIDGKSAADAADFQTIAAQHASAFAFGLLAEFGRDDMPRIEVDEVYQGKKTGSSFLSGEDRQNQQTFPPDRHRQGTLPGRDPQDAYIYTRSPREPMNLASYKKDLPTGGRVCLKRGQAALLDGDYARAEQHLTTAERLLPTDLSNTENAQVHYLQALVLLRGHRPSDVDSSIMQQVQQHIDIAIHLHPSHSYLYTLALINHERALSGSSHLWQAAQELKLRANALIRSLKDEENLQLLSRCQPRLIAAYYQW